MLIHRGMTEAMVAYAILLVFVLKILFHYTVNSISRHKAQQQKRTKFCTLAICSSHEESYVKMLDSLQTAIVLFAVLLLRPHNHLPVALHLFIFYVISCLLWPVVIDNKLGVLKSFNTRSSTLNCYQVVARILLAYWFGQHTYFTLVRI